VFDAGAGEIGEGFEGLPSSLHTGDGDLQAQQGMARRGTLFVDGSNQALIEECLSNLREAWAKRRYMAHFVSKLTDADGENSETDTWLDFAKDCGYLSSEDHAHLTRKAKEVGAMLGNMIKAPSSFITKSI
jgi:hypothetical protein